MRLPALLLLLPLRLLMPLLLLLVRLLLLPTVLLLLLLLLSPTGKPDVVLPPPTVSLLLLPVVKLLFVMLAFLSLFGLLLLLLLRFVPHLLRLCLLPHLSSQLWFKRLELIEGVRLCAWIRRMNSFLIVVAWGCWEHCCCFCC